MAMNVEARQMLCEPLALSSVEARHRVHGGAKSLWRPTCEHTELLYKPHWEVRARLEQGDLAQARVMEASAIVDGLSGIARCRRPGMKAHPETEQTEGKRLIAPTVDENAALEAAERTLRRMARRHRARLRNLEEPLLFYKPVWLLSKAAGSPPSYVVDGHSGILARALP